MVAIADQLLEVVGDQGLLSLGSVLFLEWVGREWNCGFCFVQLQTARKPLLGKEADLGYHELVEL